MIDKEKQKEALKRLSEALASNSNDAETEARKSLFCNDVESIRVSVENLVYAYDNESFNDCAFKELSPLLFIVHEAAALLRQTRFFY